MVNKVIDFFKYKERKNTQKYIKIHKDINKEADGMWKLLCEAGFDLNKENK